MEPNDLLGAATRLKQGLLAKASPWRILDSDFQNDIAVLSAISALEKTPLYIIMNVVNETIKTGDIISRKGN